MSVLLVLLSSMRGELSAATAPEAALVLAAEEPDEEPPAGAWTDGAAMK